MLVFLCYGLVGVGDGYAQLVGGRGDEAHVWGGFVKGLGFEGRGLGRDRVLYELA